jgi:arylsulfatase A-like enzyme
MDNRTISSLDIFPTAVAAARGELPADRAYDGVDLMPYLTGKNSGAPNPLLYWRAGPTFAIRDGNWKMIAANLAPPTVAAASKDKSPKDKSAKDKTANDKGAKDASDLTSKPPYPATYGQHIMLYDLTLSPVEIDNLATQQVDTVSRLKNELSDWNKLLVPPQWVSKTQHDVKADGVVIHLYD